MNGVHRGWLSDEPPVKPVKLVDTFIQVPAKRPWPTKDKKPLLRICTKKSYGKGGTRILFSAPLARQFGIGSKDDRVYVQIFVSASTIKLVKCSENAKDAIRITSGGYITVNMLKDLMALEWDQTFECKAEVVGVGKDGKEVWAMFPAALREHVDRMNGVMQ